MPFSSAQETNQLSLAQSATASSAAQIAPRPLYYTLLAAVVALLAAVAVAFFVEYLDDSIRDPEDVEKVLGLSTIGAVRHRRKLMGRGGSSRLPTLTDPHSAAAEAYRGLRANIEFADDEDKLHTLLVTSSVPTEGKTMTAANLAVAFAQVGQRVLLVDADLRNPGLHTLFRLSNVAGLTTIIEDENFAIDKVAQVTKQSNLRVVTSGALPLDPAAVLASRRMPQVLERLLRGSDLVVFDGPPLRDASDAAVLSSLLDATLLVIDTEHGDRAPAIHAGEALTRAHANLFGAVLYTQSRDVLVSGPERVTASPESQTANSVP